jgi:hypothetical protein
VLIVVGAGLAGLALAMTVIGGFTPSDCTKACFEVSSSESLSSMPVTRALMSTSWLR